MSKAGRGLWTRVTKLLAKLGLFTDVDRELLHAYCDTWSRYLDTRKALDDYIIENGGSPYYETCNGSKALHPSAKQLRELKTDLKNFARHFGLSPLARAALETAEPEQPDDDDLN